MGVIFSEPSTSKKEPIYYTKKCPTNPVYKTDNKIVYWKGDIVPFANGLKFNDSGNGYGHDDNTIFYNGKPIGNLYPNVVNLENQYSNI